MTTPSPSEVTQMLLQWSNGDREALDQLLPIVYNELRRLAQHYLQHERPDHTLQATALVHEAYLRLINQKDVRWQNRAHFFAVAAQMMRRILVSSARQRHAVKRGSGGPKMSIDELEEAVSLSSERDASLLALDEALGKLAELDPQQSRITELRYFGGLTVEETAEVLEISPATVKREWAMAKAWLHREVSRS